MTKSHQLAAKQSAAPPVATAASPLQLRPFAPRQDDLEQDGMADLMARAMGTQLIDMPVDAPGAAVQRQPDAREGEELTVQPKLSIGQPGDKYEQEADQMAARVMRMPGGDLGNGEGGKGKGERVKGKGEGVQRQALPGEKEEEEEVQMKPAVQREVMPGEEEEEETLQARLQAKGEAPAVPENFEGQLAQHKGGGRPLSDETRGFMEPRFGADFSGVRVHETPDLANAIQAQAFTHGQDIYFNSGKYSPGSSGGKELLAHELTHVVQQNSANKIPSIQADPESSPSSNYWVRVKVNHLKIRNGPSRSNAFRIGDLFFADKVYVIKEIGSKWLQIKLPDNRGKSGYIYKGNGGWVEKTPSNSFSERDTQEEKDVSSIERRARRSLRRGDAYFEKSINLYIGYAPKFEDFRKSVIHALRKKIVYRTDKGNFAKKMSSISSDLREIHDALKGYGIEPGDLFPMRAYILRRKDPDPKKRWIMHMRFAASNPNRQKAEMMQELMYPEETRVVKINNAYRLVIQNMGPPVRPPVVSGEAKAVVAAPYTGEIRGYVQAWDYILNYGSPPGGSYINSHNERGRKNAVEIWKDIKSEPSFVIEGLLLTDKREKLRKVLWFNYKRVMKIYTHSAPE